LLSAPEVSAGKNHNTIATNFNNPERTLDRLTQEWDRARHDLQHKITRLQLHRLTVTSTARRPSRSILSKLLANSLGHGRIKSVKLLAHTIQVRMRVKTLKFEVVKYHCYVHASSQQPQHGGPAAQQRQAYDHKPSPAATCPKQDARQPNTAAA
jgi:hypothetical protein